MKKEQFLIKLAQKLNSLSTNEVDEAIEYYSEIIDDHIDEGMSEEQAIEQLGDIDIIISNILNNTEKNKVSEAETIRIKANQELVEKENIKEIKPSRIILFIIFFPFWFPIIAVAFSIIFAFYAVIWSLTFAYYISLVTLPIGAIINLISTFVMLFKGEYLAMGMSFSIILISVGAFLILLVGAKYVYKFTNNLSKKVWIKLTNMLRSWGK